MLLELTVRNYAIIDSLSVSFENGLNIITGETGAGKSIIAGAIGFLMGAKADAGVVRSGCEEASVSAVISVDEKNAELSGWLREREIKVEDGELIVRRSIKTSARGAIFIQNIPVSRSDLAECMGMMFDIHGQHDHESLLRPASHRKYLDHFAGIEGETQSFNAVFHELSEKRKMMENSAVSEKERAERKEILSYAVNEIENAALKSGESRELEAESAKLSSFEKLAGFIETACETFCLGAVSAVSLTRKASSALNSASALDAGLSLLDGRLSNLYYEAEDAAGELKNYRESLSFDPQRLELVEDRLNAINRLKKKYAAETDGKSAFFSVEDAILAYKTRAEAEIDDLSRTEENKESLKKEAEALEKTILSMAASLTEKRKKAGNRLSERITHILRRLGMKDANFSVSLERKGGEAGSGASNVVIGAFGADDVEFLFSANSGEEPRELSRIASGGELSRVMLAIKTALVSSGAEAAVAGEENDFPAGNGFLGREENESARGSGGAQTLIFDEIDSGIGGETAAAVGDYLYRIGKIKQIFCVTHLAVIAVRAANHLKVEKKQMNGRTVTEARPLNYKERREEIARMLSGSVSDTALAHADELLEKAGA
ncbi:MAG: DNA repair protein RecN [Spirochaetaceae bacterium]|nr:DNA repair protein RecN [Spirochaetaceae bacterium]